MLEFFLNGIFYFFIAIVINAFIGMHFQRKKDEMEEVENLLLDNSVKFEQVNTGNQTLWMVFSYKDDLFLAQGSSEDEATENLKKRFPGRDFWKVYN